MVGLKWDVKGLKDLQNLETMLATATQDWVEAFIDEYGVEFLVMKLPEPSPFGVEHHKFDKSTSLCFAIIRILTKLNQFPTGIEKLIEVQGLALRILFCFHSDDVELKVGALQLLGIMCFYNAQGHHAVLSSFQEYKQVKGESIRFSVLRDALRSTRYSLSFKEDVLSFINILVNKAILLEVRLEIRMDFIALGMSEYFEEIRAKASVVQENSANSDDTAKTEMAIDMNIQNESLAIPLDPKNSNIAVVDASVPNILLNQLDNMEKQIDVFETFMEDDRKDFIYDKTDLTNTSSVFENLKLQCSSDEQICLLSILQHLLFIPSESNVGKQMWALCERIIREITLIASVEQVYDYTMSYRDRKVLLKVRDEFNAFLKERSDGVHDNSTFNIGFIELMQNRQTMDLFDDDMDSQVSAEENDSQITDNDTHSTDNDDDGRHESIEKFRKLLKLGMPMAHVELKMKSEGFDISLLNSENKKGNDLTANEVPSGNSEIEPIDQAAKFKKLLKMGMPRPHVELKMKYEGLDPSLLDCTETSVDSKVGDSKDNVSTDSASGNAAKDDERYSKFFKLLKMGMPRFQIELKMKSEGLDPIVLDQPNLPVPSVEKKLEPKLLVKDDPVYKKFFNLKKMGMPVEQIELKMTSEGLDAKVLATPNAVAPTKSITGDAPMLVLPKKIAKVSKLRNLYWEAVPLPETKSIWHDQEQKLPNEFKMELEKKFSKTPAKTVVRSPSKRKAKKRSSKVSLIDGKRGSNIGIMLARFRMPYNEIANAILCIDKNILSIEKLQALIRFAPEHEELNLIRSYEGDINILGDAERYFHAILDIPRYTNRLQALLATWQFHSNVEELQRLMNAVLDASSQVIHSKRLRGVLHIVLEIGNHLNDGTNRSNSSGFRFDYLPKLSQIKTADSKSTLIHVIAHQLRHIDPDLLNIEEEVPSIEIASRITNQVLQAGMSSIQGSSNIIQSELKQHRLLSSIQSNDAFQSELEPMSNETQTTATTLSKTLQNVESTYFNMCHYCGESSKSEMDPEVFFSTLGTFLKQLHSADLENEKNRIAEERRLRRLESTQTRLNSLSCKNSLSILKDGNVHDIMKQIKTKRKHDIRQEILNTPLGDQPEHLTNRSSRYSTESPLTRSPIQHRSPPTQLPKTSQQNPLESIGFI